MIVGPWGEVLAESRVEGPDVITADIDLDDVARAAPRSTSWGSAVPTSTGGRTDVRTHRERGATGRVGAVDDLDVAEYRGVAATSPPASRS